MKYYQMGGSLPDKFYNQKKSGEKTREVGSLKFKGKKREKDSAAELEKDVKQKKRWYTK